ncbi:DNA-3-methyladenine glycosylase family protein [Falsibacillus pallidus]|uniref:DNA-3-methyladenine glycosylase II n=1 Tax=Falsibacillus pallidus TaxID=493781 RepID=A0A370GUR4_9BACI|nr:DNA glycosylase [Falsibacillus pallidus]RDI45673.1 DNA-3-methyladenine glycosylase II [Falsibacillus pallidus]
MTTFKENISIPVPHDFNYEECLVFLGRSESEVLHVIEGNAIYKAFEWNKELYIMKITCNAHGLEAVILEGKVSDEVCQYINDYVIEWFDLDRDLDVFFDLMKQDPILQTISGKYDGLRIIGIPDLFEALTWAVIGQQISLKFAYTLKKRLVESFGQKVVYNGRHYWTYPSIQTIANLEIEQLRALQFTSRKAEYIIGIAKHMQKGNLSKKKLLCLRKFEKMHLELTKIRGVGAWTADYVLMKCLLQPEAFPISDAGLHNAIKKINNMHRKPELAELKSWSKNWEGWQAYAVFYLWRSLYE